MRWFQRLPRALPALWSRPDGPPRPAPSASRRTLTALRIPALALLLVVSGVAPGSAVTSGAPAVSVPEPWVTPAEFTDAVDPGGSTGVDKQVRTPAIPPKPDVVLLVDGTGSMGKPIGDVQKGLKDITTKVRGQQPDSRFAVATYGDEKDDPTAEFAVLQGLTTNLDDVQKNGVDQLKTSRGYRSKGPSED